MHSLIAVPIEGEAQGAEGAGVVEFGEIDLVGEAGGVPVELWFDVEIKKTQQWNDILGYGESKITTHCVITKEIIFRKAHKTMKN